MNRYIVRCQIGNLIHTTVYTEPSTPENAIKKARALAPCAVGGVAYVSLYFAPESHGDAILRYDAPELGCVSRNVVMTVLTARPQDLYDACVADAKRIEDEERVITDLLAIVGIK